MLYLNRVLEQFQHMAVLDSMTELSLQINDVHTLITAALQTALSQTDEKHIILSGAIESGLVSIQCDPELFQRALGELFENAIRFTPQGDHIQLRAAIVNRNQLMLEVVDMGKGIPQYKLPHIFERFYKGDEARPMTGGAGLGLAMVKRIIELHHGTIEVESTLGIQTIFRIMLPAVVSNPKIPVNDENVTANALVPGTSSRQ